MSEDKAPRVFVTYSHDSPEHKDQVLRFATVLRARLGLDVHLDQWYDNKRRDWSLWAIEHLRDADYVLVIASPDYKRRADGVAAPDEGRGAQFEASMLRDALTRDLRAETGRILPVVLPGRSIADIPTFLNAHSTTRYEITEVTDAGVADLIAAITGIGRQTMPKRGPWPHTKRAHVPLADAQVPLSAGPQSPVLSSGLHREAVRLDGVDYPDSIVFRPTSAQSGGFVEVDLSGAYARLTAVVGVPDDAADAFQVGQFLVYVDGHLRSDVRAAPGKPVTVDVDVTGASQLRLEMFRPVVGVSPLATTTNTRTPMRPLTPTSGARPDPTYGSHSGRLPELAWGAPTLW
jgi:hypothetical protein